MKFCNFQTAFAEAITTCYNCEYNWRGGERLSEKKNVQMCNELTVDEFKCMKIHIHIYTYIDIYICTYIHI